MPTSSARLMTTIGLTIEGQTTWGAPPPTSKPGIYLVSLSRRAYRNDAVRPTAPVCEQAVAQWLQRVPKLELDGKPGPTTTELVACLQGFWLPDESILYIGKATSLATRLNQFFRHKLGNRSPHAGGHWIKTLACLDELQVYYCTCDTVADAEAAEAHALDAFARQVSPASRSALVGVSVPIPFGNRVCPKHGRKQTRLRRDVRR
ncbi:MAG: hypothetical protein WD009_05200 [Phycisphaeraceae bacterium]